MNGDQPHRGHTRFITICITTMGIICLISGAILIYRGYGGDLLIGGGLAAISGLVGLLGQGRAQPATPDVTISGSPPKVELTQQPQPEPKP